MDKPKLEDILKEIGFTDELKVKVSQGKIRAIPKQTISRPSKYGIRTEHKVEETIELE